MQGLCIQLKARAAYPVNTRQGLRMELEARAAYMPTAKGKCCVYSSKQGLRIELQARAA